MLFYLVVGLIAVAFIIAILNFIKASQERGRGRKHYGANHSYRNNETTDNNYWGSQESQTTLHLFSDNIAESNLHSDNLINSHSTTGETNVISTDWAEPVEHSERHSSHGYSESDLYNNEHSTYSSDTNWGGAHESSHSSTSTFDSFDSSSSGSGSDSSTSSSSSGE